MNTKFTLLLTTITVTIATTSKAQISKGSTFIGGNLSLSSNTLKPENDDSYKMSTFSIAPSVGFVYKDNKVVGFSLRYAHSKNAIDSNYKSNTYGASVFLRQYKPLGKGFYLFAQESVNADISQSKRSVFGETSKDNNNNFYVAINPGVAYDLNKKVQFEILLLNNLLSAGYYSNKTTYDPGNIFSDSRSNGFYLSANDNLNAWTTVSFGAKLFLGR